MSKIFTGQMPWLEGQPQLELACLADGNPMTDQSPAAFFTDINRALSDLRNRPATTGDGHMEVAKGIWISCEKGSGASIALKPVPHGNRLIVEKAEQSQWVALGWAVPLDVLRGGRFAGVRIRAVTPGFFSFRMALRLVRADGGFDDHYAPEHTLFSGGAREQFSFAPYPQTALATAQRAEVNLFFQSSFSVEIQQLEMLLAG